MALIRPESKVGIRGGIHFVLTEKSRKLGGGGRPEPALRTKPGWSHRLWWGRAAGSAPWYQTGAHQCKTDTDCAGAAGY